MTPPRSVRPPIRDSAVWIVPVWSITCRFIDDEYVVAAHPGGDVRFGGDAIPVTCVVPAEPVLVQ